mmetsp:Transcript_90298/g.234150  ORF Transcript_90298/g.234150 Transcript_90298/m.234150 type:complete len:270 (-) Transcript_90298:757-1566(-)
MVLALFTKPSACCKALSNAAAESPCSMMTSREARLRKAPDIPRASASAKTFSSSLGAVAAAIFALPALPRRCSAAAEGFSFSSIFAGWAASWLCFGLPHFTPDEMPSVWFGCSSSPALAALRFRWDFGVAGACPLEVACCASGVSSSTLASPSAGFGASSDFCCCCCSDAFELLLPIFVLASDSSTCVVASPLLMRLALGSPCKSSHSSSALATPRGSCASSLGRPLPRPRPRPRALPTADVTVVPFGCSLACNSGSLRSSSAFVSPAC